MPHMSFKCRLFSIALFVIAMSLAQLAFAGPPLICHPIDIGDAHSLPWGQSARDKSYDRARLADDALAILDSKAPITVRMETLRRAAIYADGKPECASELLGKLMARTLDAEAGESEVAALAWFDAGYFAACLSQVGAKPSFGPMAVKHGGAPGVPGYRWVAKAIQLGGGAEMELAAALITVDHRCPEFDHHLRSALGIDDKARSRAFDSVLLWIAEIKGTTLDGLRARYGLADARRER